MSKHRRAAKVDNNQGEIVKALRQIPGVTVETSHDDILVGYRGITYWFEIKTEDTVGVDGNVRESAKKDSQKMLEAEWRGHYRIVWKVEQILIDLGIS